MSLTEPNTTSRSLAVDHQVPGDLTDVLFQRNIAVGMTTDGSILLTRPNSAVVRVPRDRTDRAGLAEAVQRFNPASARLVAASKSAGAVMRVDLGRDGAMLGERRWGLGRVNEFLREGRGRWEAEYNHVVIGSQTMGGDPLGAVAHWAGEMAFMGNIHEDPATGQKSLLSTAQPSPEPSFWRSPLALPGRPPCRVLVLDTGLRTVATGTKRSTSASRRPEHPRLQDCKLHAGWRVYFEPPGAVDDEDERFDEDGLFDESPMAASPRADAASSVLDFEAGHGTFIAGIVKQFCPDAEIVSAGVLSSFGEGDVSDVLTTLEALNQPDPFDIVVMSFGANLIDDEAGLFGEELMRLLGPSLGVAAAGNQSTCRPYFPAALPGVIGVGALAADGKAWFTNFGGWVDACAPGVDVISTFFENFDEVLNGETTRQYRGWARWSGTSFSAPKVAAVIAQEQYLFGGTAKDAWKRITSHKHFRYPDLGIVFNV